QYSLAQRTCPMKRTFSLLALFLVALPAQAHFIWLLPDEHDQPAARMVFSDELAPDKNVPITKIGRTKLTAVSVDGHAISVKVGEDKHCYQVSIESKDGNVAIGGVCQYGVIAKGKGDPFLLMYYPKTVVGKQVGLSLPAGLLSPKFKKSWTA